MPTLLLTRPRPQSEAFAQRCRAMGFAGEIVLSPMIEIVPRPWPTDVQRYPTLLFTSAQATGGLAGHAVPGQVAYAVGDRTAQAVEEAGIPCTSARGDADALMHLLLAESPKVPLLHLRGVHSRGDLADRLSRAGLPTDEAIVYDQRACKLSCTARAVLSTSDPVVVPVFSPRTARLLGADVPGEAGSRRILALSNVVATAWPHSDTVRVATSPDAESMAKLVCESAFG